MMKIQEVVEKVTLFEDEVNRILSRYDSSPTRTMNLNRTLELLNSLSLKQQNLFMEAIGCCQITQLKLYRSSIVLAWSAMADYLEQWLSEDSFLTLSSVKGRITEEARKHKLRKSRMNQQEQNREIAEAKVRAEEYWKFDSVEDLRDAESEFSIITCMMECKFITKTEMKNLHGLLSKRNECAHPHGHEPDFAEAVGYLSEILNRIKKYESKRL